MAVSALKLLRERGTKLHIVAQNLIEVWVVATRPEEQNGLGRKVASIADELNEIKSLFVLLPETQEIYPAWEKLVTENQVLGKAAHDARLVAAMRAHGITDILTFNTADFGRYPGITPMHPEQVLLSLTEAPLPSEAPELE